MLRLTEVGLLLRAALALVLVLRLGRCLLLDRPDRDCDREVLRGRLEDRAAAAASRSACTSCSRVGAGGAAAAAREDCRGVLRDDDEAEFVDAVSLPARDRGKRRGEWLFAATGTARTGSSTCPVRGRGVGERTAAA